MSCQRAVETQIFLVIEMITEQRLRPAHNTCVDGPHDERRHPGFYEGVEPGSVRIGVAGALFARVRRGIGIEQEWVSRHRHLPC